jgi:hypothetical protein
VDPVLINTVASFADFDFQPEIATKHATGEATETLNETNIVARLGELEEYINTLVLQLSHKRNERNAQLAAIPVDTLPMKDFTNDPGQKAAGKVDFVETLGTED